MRLEDVDDEEGLITKEFDSDDSDEEYLGG